MKKILVVLALAMTVVASNAEARGGYGGWHHGGRYFFYGALTFPLWYSAWAYSRPSYNYNYYPAPVYVQTTPNYTPTYVVTQPNYTVATPQPLYVAAGQQSMPAQSNGVVELGPVNGAPQQSVQPSLANAPASMPVQPGTQAGRWYVYPGRGQTQAQLTADRSQCNSWAVGESGYDPDLRVHRNPETGPNDYGRALSACLEGRGYTVR